MISGKSIFISPLDWGLGHAARCVPIIRELEIENKILIGVTPLTKRIFDEEFPHLEKINVPAYDIKYSGILPLWLKLICDWPRILEVIKKEHEVNYQIVKAHKIDIIISDNRFGLFSKQAHSIFITHQLFLKTPVANAIAQIKNRNYIKNFDEIWIPDYESESESLSGMLSHGDHFHGNVKYIGPKSRLQKINSIGKQYDYLFLLSGPEPQHSIVRNKLLRKAVQYPGLKFCVVTNSVDKIEKKDTIEIVISPTNNKLSELISQSKKIVCRSGYSTLMDLHYLNKKEVILIPTPGQTEQEYLAAYWNKKFGSCVVLQKDIMTHHFD